MSYILDALQRAQAERERGAVPGLHSHNAPLAPPARRSSGLLGWGLVALGLAVIAWLWWSPTPNYTSHTSPTSPIEPSSVSATAPTEVSPTPPAGPAAPITLLPSAPAALAETPAKAPAPTTATPTAAAPSPPAAAPAVASVPVVDGIPANLRAQVGELRITGAVYAQDPTQRLLLVNNLVLQQGQSVSPGLTLERIEAKSAVFNYQGTRFRIKH
jgi:general secretion pathway protein B